VGEPGAPGELDALRRDFPRYAIDVMLTYDSRRYVAQRRQPGPGPHTLVTKDPAELRTELAARGSGPDSRSGLQLRPGGREAALNPRGQGESS